MITQILVVYEDILFHSEYLGNGISTNEVKIQGMKSFTQQEWFEYQQEVETLGQTDWYYDTHDCMQYENGMQILDKMTIKTFDDEKTWVTVELLLTNKNASFGFFPLLEQL